MNKVAVLCRGKSLGSIKLLPDDIDLYILVNEFGDELELDEVGPYLKGKTIYHLMSRTGGIPDKMIQQKQYSEFNIQGIIQPYTIHMKNPKDFNDGNNKYYKFIEEKFYFCGEDKPIPATWLGDHHIEHMDSYEKRYPHHYPTSGNAAFAYAILDTPSTEIILIGMDFYDVGYLAEGGPGGPSSGIKMKDSILKLINNSPDKKFTIYTYGDLEINLPNCNLIKLKD